jgi:hypothetical protein
MTTDIDRLLEHLRGLQETTLHVEVILPLLKHMFTSVRYVHGTLERGKDILYISETPFGTHELHVCQVKNAPFDARATSPASFAYTANQLIQAAQTKVLNPETNQLTLPDRVVLLSTYPVEDRVVAGADYTLNELQVKHCTILPPERLAHLIRQHLPDYYSKAVGTGVDVFAKLRTYVGAHREAEAFGARNERERFRINVDIEFAVDQIDVLNLARRGVFADRTSYIEPAIGHAFRAMSKEANSAGGRVSVAQILSWCVQKVDESLATINAPEPTEEQLLAAVAQIYDLVILVDRLVKTDQTLAHRVEEATEDLASGAETSAIVSLHDAPIGVLANLPFNVLITGGAGAGKTSLLTGIASRLLEVDQRIVYFPCYEITNKSRVLESAIPEFLCRISGVDEASVDAALNACRKYLIDGCDEAATFGSQLAAELSRFAAHGELVEPVNPEYRGTFHVPIDLRSGILHLKGRHGSRLVLREPLHSIDFDRLIFANGGTDFEVPLETLRRRSFELLPRLYVTSRPSSKFRPPADFVRLRIRPFTNVQVEAFFKRWFTATPEVADKAVAYLRKTPRMLEVCQTPLVASIVAGLLETGQPLPHSKAEVYARRLDLLLERWDQVRRVPVRCLISAAEKRAILRKLALEMHEEHTRTVGIDRIAEIWNAGPSERYQGVQVETLIEELIVANSVLLDEGSGRYSLGGHLSYQEFLAAEAVIFQGRKSVLIKNLHDPWWHQVVVFYAGLVGDMSNFLDAVARRRGFSTSIMDVLREINAEAKFTSPLTRQVLQDMLEEGL